MLEKYIYLGSHEHNVACTLFLSMSVYLDLSVYAYMPKKVFGQSSLTWKAIQTHFTSVIWQI